MASKLDSSTLSGISAGFDINEFEDTVAFTDPIDEEPLFPSDWDTLQTPPYDGNLYSTPLNWDPPQPKVEPLPPASYTTMSALTPAQQEKLRNIAMPHHLQYQGHHSPQSTSSYKSNSVSSPEDHNRKRKSSASGDDEDDEDEGGQHPPVKKTAHNMIEKRYRTNLNDKIAALRDSVPSLRIMTKSARGEDTADDREELHGLTPAHKLNKATVLSKATEYINHLEKRNKRLNEENVEQKARLAAFETLFRSGSMGYNPHPQVNNPFQYPREYNTPGPSPTVDPQGMIQVPEDIRRLHAQASQQTYQMPQEQYAQQPGRQPAGPNGWQSGGGYFGKLMVGSLAGLMIMEGFTEAEQSDDTPEGRGLGAVPLQLLKSLSQRVYSSLDLSVLGYHVPAAKSVAYMKLFLVVGTLLYIFLPSIFASKRKSSSGKTQSASLSAAPSLASSISVRRQAWLTAIQTVWVPRHNFFLEAAALCMKIAKLSTRNFIGADGYAYLSGNTQQQEAARVKAWEIALDAQLAGGDVEVSKSRLTLTLLASGTLPDTPARLMLKALHIRVLLWEVGNAGFNGYYLFHEMAAKMSRWKWNEAKQLQRIIANAKDKVEGEFPDHLVALLGQECDDVLADCIGQRAYNLAWNLPTTYNVRGPSDGMDEVVDDFAIRSPLDAVAAWYSSIVLQRALAKTLATGYDEEKKDSVLIDIDLAIKVSPVGSRSQIRALVARAVLIKDKRGENIAISLQGLRPFGSKAIADTTPTFINTTSSVASLPDIRMSLWCAMAIAYLDRYSAPHNPPAVHRLINSIVPINLSLLGFTAAFHLMQRIDAHECVSLTCAVALEKLAGSLRIWIGGPAGEKSGLDKAVKRELVERCLVVTKRVIGMEKDAGYETMSEEDAGEGC